MDADNKNEETKINLPNEKVIRESSAEILSGGKVFYNPVQEFNRDLSIAVLNVYFKKTKEEGRTISKTKIETTETNVEYVAGNKYEDGLRILEALSATGLRSIRYAKEIAGVREIIANDLSKQAVESINENIHYNGVEHLIQSSHADAMTVMYLSTAPAKHFDVIDLDPYGCPNRFLDAAVQSIVNGGLLLVTATDMAVLAGNTPEACFAKYGSTPLRMKSCHEMALRILLHCIETHANRYGKYIEPLISISADFYVRVFVRVYSSQAKCKYSMSKQSMIYQCTGCDTFTLQPLGTIKPNPIESNPNQVKFGIPTGPPVSTHCTHCGHTHHMGGPIWSAPIHNKSFVSDVLQAVQTEPLFTLGTQKRIIGMLTVVQEELQNIPLYYSLDRLCNILKLQMMPMLKIRSALLHAGYYVSYSHACKTSIKTNASADILWDILRCWSKRNPVKEERMLDGTPLKAILSKPCCQEYNFDELHPDANPESRRCSLARFQINPKANWGPGTRARIMIGEDKTVKSLRNQNKKQKHRNGSNASSRKRTEITPIEQQMNDDAYECEIKNPKLDSLVK